MAALAALQLSTLHAETVVQTLLAGVLLVPALAGRRALTSLLSAGVLAALLASPVLLGVWALVEGTARAQGFPAAATFGWSARVPVLLEALLPRLFGTVHSFSDQGYWAQPFFPTGQPYILSLYLGGIEGYVGFADKLVAPVTQDEGAFLQATERQALLGQRVLDLEQVREVRGSLHAQDYLPDLRRVIVDIDLFMQAAIQPALADDGDRRIDVGRAGGRGQEELGREVALRVGGEDRRGDAVQGEHPGREEAGIEREEALRRGETADDVAAGVAGYEGAAVEDADGVAQLMPITRYGAPACGPFTFRYRPKP